MGWFKELLGLEKPLPAEVVSITDDNYKAEVLYAKGPVLLDVWSEGCGPCRLLEPVVLELSRRYQGRLKVAEVNAANAPKTMRKLGVTGTPTVLYFEGGQVVERVVGFRPLAWHQALIDEEFPAPRAAAPGT